MTPELRFSLDIGQVVILGGLIWSLARMSKSVDVLVSVTGDHTKALEKVGVGLGEVATRIRILEDRDDQRRHRRHDDPDE